MSKLIYFASLVILSFSSHAEEFILTDSDCKTMAGMLTHDDIKKDSGSKSSTYCKLNKKEALCTHKDRKTGKGVNTEKYQVVGHEDGYIFLRSNSGNISYIISKKTKKFTHTQYNFVPKIMGFISKSCVGTYTK